MPRLNITEFDRTLLPYSIQARYESGKMTEEELQKYMSETGRALTAQRIQGNTTVPQKSELDLNNQQQPAVEDIGLIEASKRLQSLTNDINNKYAELYSGFTALDQPRLQGQPSGSAVARGLAQPTRQKTDDEYTQELLKGESIVSASLPELERMKQEAAALEKYLVDKGPVGTKLINDVLKNWKNALATGAAWAGTVAGGAVGAIPAVDVFSGGTINPVTGAAAGRTLGATLGAMPITMEQKRQSYVEARLNGANAQDAEEFSNYITGTEFLGEALGGMVPGGGAARGLFKNSFKEWAKKTGKEAAKGYAEEAATGVFQDLVKAGTAASDNTASKYALEELPSSFLEAINSYNEQGLIGAVAQGTMASPGTAVETIQQGKEVTQRVKSAQELYNKLQASPEAQANPNVLIEGRQKIAATFKLNPEEVVPANLVAKQVDERRAAQGAREQAVKTALSEVKLTGVPAFDAGQMAAAQQVETTKSETSIKEAVIPTLPEQFAKEVQSSADKVIKLEQQQLVQEVKLKEALAPVKTKKTKKTVTEKLAATKQEVASVEVTPIPQAETKQEPVPVQEASPSPAPMSAPRRSALGEIITKIKEETKKPAKAGKKWEAKAQEALEQKAEKATVLAEKELYNEGAFQAPPESHSDLINKRAAEILKSGQDLKERESSINEQTVKLKKQRQEKLDSITTAVRQSDVAAKTIAKAYGQDVADTLIANGNVRIGTDDSISPSGGVSFGNGRIYLNTKQIEASGKSPDEVMRQTVRAVAAHEFLHEAKDDTLANESLVKFVVGDKYQAFVNDIKQAAQNGDKLSQNAVKRATTAETSQEAQDDEIAAYFVEELEKSYVGLKGASRRAVDTLVSKTREMLTRAGVPIKTVRPKDLAYLSKKAATKIAEKGARRPLAYTKAQEQKQASPTQASPNTTTTSQDNGTTEYEFTFTSKTDPSVVRMKTGTTEDIAWAKMMADGDPRLAGALRKDFTISKTPVRTTKQSIGYSGAKGFRQAKEQGKLFTDPVTGLEAFDIPDDNVTVDAKALKDATGPVSIAKVMRHPLLYINWPFLKDIQIAYDYALTPNEQGAFDTKNKTILLNQNIKDPKLITSIILHETTHAIQDHLGISSGSNVVFARDLLLKVLLAGTGINVNDVKTMEKLKKSQTWDKFDALFKSVYDARKAMEAEGLDWPADKLQRDIEKLKNDPKLANLFTSIQPLMTKLTSLTDAKNAYLAYEAILKAEEGKWWAYQMNPGEIVARAVQLVYSGEFSGLLPALTVLSKQGPGPISTAKEMYEFGKTMREKTQGERGPKFSKGGNPIYLDPNESTILRRTKELWGNAVPDKRVLIALEARQNSSQLYMAKLDDILSRLNKQLKVSNVTREDVNKAWMDASKNGTLATTGDPQIDSLMQEVRDIIDQLSTRIVDIHDELGIPLLPKQKQTIYQNVGKYLTSSYEINYDKEWGKNVLKAARQGNKDAQKLIAELRDWVGTEIIDKISNVDTLGDKEVKELYFRLYGSKQGKLGDMRDKIKKFSAGRNVEELKTAIQNDLLRVTKDTKLLGYYQGASRNTGILKAKTKVPAPLAAAWGLREGFAETSVPTIIKQARLLGETEFQADLLKRMPDRFTEVATPENGSRIPDDIAKYGLLAGRFTSPDMLRFVESQAEVFNTYETALFNPVSAASQDTQAKQIINLALGLLKFTAKAGTLQVRFNPKNWLLNVMGAFQTASGLLPYLGTKPKTLTYTASNGKQVDFMDWMGASAQELVTKKVPKGEAGEVWEYALRTGVHGAATAADLQEQYENAVKRALKDGSKQNFMPGFARDMAKAKRGFQATTGAVSHVANVFFNTPETLVTMMTFVSEANQVRAVWDAEGKTYSHDDLMKEAADRTKIMTINRDRAFRLPKTLDKFGATAFLTFFTESMRAPTARFYAGAAEIATAKKKYQTKEAQNLAVMHGWANVTSATTMLAVSFAMTKMVASALGNAFGDDDDEVKEALPEGMQAAMDDIMVVGESKTGTKLLWDTSQLNTYETLTAPIAELLNGDLGDAGNRLLDTVFMNPLIGAVIDQVVDENAAKAKTDWGKWLGDKSAEYLPDSPLKPSFDTIQRFANVLNTAVPSFGKGIVDYFQGDLKADKDTQATAYYLQAFGVTPMEYDIMKALPSVVSREKDKVSEATKELNAILKQEGPNPATVREAMMAHELAQQEMVKTIRPVIQAAIKSKRADWGDIIKVGFIGGEPLPAGVQRAMLFSIYKDIPYRSPPPKQSILSLSEEMLVAGTPNKEEQRKIRERYQKNRLMLYDEWKKYFGPGEEK